MTKQKLIVLASVSILSVISLVWTAHAQAPAPTPEERFQQDLSIWLGKLAMCESNNNPSAINPKDSDGKPAYGLMQYKLSTFLALSKKYNVFPELNVDLVHKYAMDGQKSYYLTREVIERNPSEADQWGCRWKKEVGKPPVKKDYL